MHFGAIIIMFGARYKSYCSNIVRTILVDPTEDVQKNYNILLKVEDAIIEKIQHGEYSSVFCRTKRFNFIQLVRSQPRRLNSLFISKLG